MQRSAGLVRIGLGLTIYTEDGLRIDDPLSGKGVWLQKNGVDIAPP